MKRVKQHSDRTLPPVRMDAEGLRAIVELAQTHTVTVGEYEYENVDEALQHLSDRTLNECTITLMGDDYRSVDIYIEPRLVRVDTSAEMEPLGAYAVEQLRRRSPWYSYTSLSFLWLMLSFTIWTVLWAVLSVFFLSLGVVVLSSVVFGLFISSMVLSATVRWPVGGSSVYMGDRSQRPTFLRRNRDALLVNFLTGVMGFLLGLLFARLTG